jgi:heptosyltransferase-2
MPSLSKPRLSRYRYTRRRWHVLFTIIDTVGAWLFALGRFLSGSREPKPLDDVRSILLIQLDHLGDALLTTAMLPALRKRFPQARLEVLAAPWNKAVFASHDVDAIHVCETNRFQREGNWLWPLALVAWAWKLRAKQFDLAIDVRGELPHAALMWLAGIKRRVGWSDGGGEFLLSDSLQHEPGQHELESRRRLLRVVEVPEVLLKAMRPRWPIDERDRLAVQSWLDMRLAGARPLVVVHVGAGTQAKRWTLEHLQELLGRLVVELDARVVLVGSAEERGWSEQITLGQDWPQVVDRVGLMTLGEVAALCERAAVFVGADSGPAHLAAAVDCPVVTLFSGTNVAAQWRPVGNLVRVLRHEVACSPCHCQSCPLADHPCMTGIQPQQVIAALRELIVTPLPLPETRAVPSELLTMIATEGDDR